MAAVPHATFEDETPVEVAQSHGVGALKDITYGSVG